MIKAKLKIIDHYPAKSRGISPDTWPTRSKAEQDNEQDNEDNEKDNEEDNEEDNEQDNGFIIQHIDDKAQFSTFIGEKSW